MRTWIKRLLVSAPLVFILFIVIVSSCMTFRQSDKKTIASFEENNIEAEIHHVKYNSRPIRYIESGFEKDKDNLIVFIHGAPGSSRDLLSYLYDSSLLSVARMISIDRPGYGYSGYGEAVTSIEQQSLIINELIGGVSEKNIILVGHSFGGPIAAKASVLNKAIDAVVMLAPVNDPYNEKMFWVSYLGKWKITRWMVSDALKVATDEKFTHADELLLMQEDWNKINVPVLHIHGHKDWLAPLSNVEWSRQNIAKEQLILLEDPELDHFIPFTQKSLVVNELIKLINSLDRK